NMNQEYNYKVVWCPICNQGWVEIVKEKDTNELFILCSECETEWDTPNEISVKNGTRSKYGRVIEPTHEEIINKGWQNFILNS
ncbi:MAG: hypothetical protein CVU89_12690, partial [Firmicutes bacterium HGW-Firmicutes-14]